MLYTVDRTGSLEEGKTYGLTIYNDVEPKILNDHVNALFPEGVSCHGERYLLRPESKALSISPMLELTFEYIRRSFYSKLPSRFQCAFAFESIYNAKEFIRKHGKENSSIYEISGEITFKADMSLLHNGSILEVSYLGHLYWLSQSYPERPGVWEYLVKCPFIIGARKV